MLDQTYQLPQSVNEILGDLTGLAGELGGTDGLSELSVANSLSAARVNSVATLESFLQEYTQVVLVPHELPAVYHAYHYAVRGESRELVALDQQLSSIPALQGFARASSHVGRTQLRRLRPLRSERVVQRYLKAVELGEAKAWHTLVFGIVLALYSLPLRQGLVHFGYQTLGGFIHAAGTTVPIALERREQLLSSRLAGVTTATEDLLAGSTPKLL